MKTREIFNHTGKSADDYSELDLFRLIEKTGSKTKESLTDIVLSEIRDQQLRPTVEEGQKLLKALSEIHIYNIGEK